MKFVGVSSIVILSTLTVLAIGCAKTKDDNSDGQAYKFPYNLKAGNCETGPQNPKSPEETCALLKDEAANNNCAKEQREKIYIDRCTGAKPNATATTSTTLPGDTSTATTLPIETAENEPTAKGKDLSGMIRTHILAEGGDSEITEAIKLIANKSADDKSSISGLLTVSCTKDIQSALALKTNGAILFDLGKMIMLDDKESLQLQDMTTQPAILVDCIGNASLKSADLLKTKVVSSENYEIKNLKLGESTRETLILSQEGGLKESSEVSVSCIKDETESILSGKNGLQLKAGARLLLKRDLELAELKDISAQKDKVVLTCGLE